MRLVLQTALLLGLAVSARAQFNPTRMKVPRDEMARLVKETAERRARINHKAGYSIVEGADGSFYVVVYESGNAFAEAGDVTVEKFGDVVEAGWAGDRTPVTLGHVDLSKDCELRQDWVGWAVAGGGMLSVIKRANGVYKVGRDDDWQACDAGLCGPEAAAAFKPFLDACASAKP